MSENTGFAIVATSIVLSIAFLLAFGVWTSQQGYNIFAETITAEKGTVVCEDNDGGLLVRFDQ